MPQPAATIAANLVHGPPTMGAPVPTVLVGGRPAWVVSCMHTCPIPNAPPPAGPGTPHGPGVTMPPGGIKVMVGMRPAGRMGDQVMEAGAVMPPMIMNPIIFGVPTVLM